MDIKMPQLGESVTEGTINKWLVKPGDSVTKYQPLAEVITDKVNAEIPAPQDGVIGSLLIAEGTTVKVGTLIATMNEAGAAAPAPSAAPATTAPVAGAAPATVSSAPPGENLLRGPNGDLPGGSPPGALAKGGTATLDRGNARYSPAVLKLAQENGLDLTRIPGSGLGGRITRKDVEAVIAAGGQPAAAPVAQPVAADPSCVGGMVAAQAGTEQVISAPVAAPSPAPAARPLVQTAEGDQILPVDPVRRAIANKMLQSKHEAPHAWTMMTADVTGLVKLKELHGAEFKRREGISLSFVPFFIKAVVESLKEYPIINSQWAGDQIVIKKEINISIAVATETALAVPVIKNADRQSIAGLAHSVVELAGKARSGKLSLAEISGGTFTVNNTGAFGSFMSAPIINHPQAAILSFEAITKQPVVLENDAIAIRSIMNLCLSLDHRVLDGLVCGRFLQAVKTRLQSYGPGTVNLY
ncbi:MAG TPA: dihydrolipoamide acetyltransferase family protein [Symbiobacteriaceae bacterium]|nr:dihydrolipoamide acetyltransferase family protein [Symbiobacteriaceae bacterium]